jgi:AcrR family transcriptional regulator
LDQVRYLEIPARRKDIPPQRRRQILNSARELFANSGYHGATVDAIAHHAGISKGNLYWYFKSKQEIFCLLFDDVAEKLYLPFQRVLDSDKSAREKLYELAQESLDSAESNRELMHLLWQIAAQPELQELLSAGYSYWLSPFLSVPKQLFEEIGDNKPGDTALLYGLTLDAVMFLATIGPDFYHKEKLLSAISEKFLIPGGNDA